MATQQIAAFDRMREPGWRVISGGSNQEPVSRLENFSVRVVKPTSRSLPSTAWTNDGTLTWDVCELVQNFVSLAGRVVVSAPSACFQCRLEEKRQQREACIILWKT